MASFEFERQVPGTRRPAAMRRYHDVITTSIQEAVIESEQGYRSETSHGIWPNLVSHMFMTNQTSSHSRS